MTEREKLIDLAHDYFKSVPWYADIADLNPEELIDHILANGVRLESEQATSDENKRWIPVTERLPEEKTCVLISCGGNVHVAKIEMGIDEQMRDAMKRGELSDPLIPSWSASTGYTLVKRSMLYSGCDVHGNNLVPYCWYSNYGPGKWFGQEVSHWMLLPEPPKEDV